MYGAQSGAFHLFHHRLYLIDEIDTPMETTSINNQEDKTIAIISYITLFGLIIAFIMNKDKKLPLARFHIRQGLGLLLTSLALIFVNIIPILGWLVAIPVSFVLLYMWIMGLIHAMNGRQKAVPFLGEKYVQWFENIH